MYVHMSILCMYVCNQDTKNKSDTLLQLLHGLCFYGPVSRTPQELLFCFKSGSHLPTMDYGWNICDITKEYDRLGLFGSPQWMVRFPFLHTVYTYIFLYFFELLKVLLVGNLHNLFSYIHTHIIYTYKQTYIHTYVHLYMMNL